MPGDKNDDDDDSSRQGEKLGWGLVVGSEELDELFEI